MQNLHDEKEKKLIDYRRDEENLKRNALYGTTEQGVKEAEELHKLLQSNGIYRKEDFDDFNQFYIFPRNDPYKMLGTTREYIFITKPDLHIFGDTQQMNLVSPTAMDKLNPELAGVPFFTDLVRRGYGDTVLSSLQYSKNPVNPFVTLLSNYKTSSLDLSSVSVDDEETGVNIYNTRIYYRKPSDSADENNDFNIEFKDNKYLDCYLWFKAYDLYEQRKYHGQITPTRSDYITKKILSDQMTVFKFIVGEDGESLIYWACLWGCYPKSVPRATFSDISETQQLRFSIDWKSTFQQDMDPIIIIHFNRLCKQMKTNIRAEEISLYDDSIGRVTGESAAFPYIVDTGDATSGYGKLTHTPYKLKWYKEI